MALSVIDLVSYKNLGIVFPLFIMEFMLAIDNKYSQEYNEITIWDFPTDPRPSKGGVNIFRNYRILRNPL